MNIKPFLVAALSAFVAEASIAQTTPNDILTTSGDYYSGASASLSWTLGEPLIETGSSSNHFLTQGFQQPPGIVITSVDNTNVSSGISAYPNPVISSVFITSTINEPLKVDVMDITGRKLLSKFFPTNGEKEVNLTDYSNGMYLFRVYNTDGQLLQTLKIQKIK